MADSQLAFNFPVLALMTVDEIYLRANQALLEQLSEDRRLERKPVGVHSNALGPYFSMWANTAPEGGLIVVGMQDDGVFSGVSSAGMSKLNDLERAGYIYCPDARYESKRVPVTNALGSEDFVLLIRVFYRSDTDPTA